MFDGAHAGCGVAMPGFVLEGRLRAPSVRSKIQDLSRILIIESVVSSISFEAVQLDALGLSQ